MPKRTVEVNGDEVTLYAVPQAGGWYEITGWGVYGKAGTLYAPMLADGSFDPNDVQEVLEPHKIDGGA